MLIFHLIHYEMTEVTFSVLFIINHFANHAEWQTRMIWCQPDHNLFFRQIYKRVIFVLVWSRCMSVVRNDDKYWHTYWWRWINDAYSENGDWIILLPNRCVCAMWIETSNILGCFTMCSWYEDCYLFPWELYVMNKNIIFVN